MVPLFFNLKLPIKYSLDIKIAFVAVFYYAAARMGYFFAFDGSNALPSWPPSGIAFALLILMGRQVWPGIMIGCLVANLMAQWNQPNLPPQTIILVSTIVALANTLEAAIGSYLVRNWIKSEYPFTRTKHAFRFLIVALVMCLAGVIIGVFGLYINNIIGSDHWVRTAFEWWVRNVVGILLFTPLILASRQAFTLSIPAKKWLETGIFFVAAVGICLLFQVDYLAATMQRALPFLVLPFLLWLAFRFDLIVAVTGVLATSLASIFITVNELGPFNLPEAHDTVLLLQIFISVIGISTIILSSTVRERLDIQQKLLVFNENLETMVLERTSALNHEVMVRKKAEQSLQRTNTELSKRNTELDNFVYSVSHDLRAPIASVLGLVNLAKKDIDVDMKDMYLDMIYKSAVQQDSFISEILDQSRNSRLEVKAEEILFGPLIEETFNQLKFSLNSGYPVEKVIAVNQDRPFVSDRWRLKVILNNIISNAIRYRNGHEPVIKVNVNINEHSATVAVEDNGKGIESGHLPNVYKMFYRATDDGAGSGLGLYIVKEAIEKLNGNIDIESEVGKGTVVKFQIPSLN